MANRLQLKRGSGAPGSIFYAGEPIFDQSGKILYVGDTGGTGTGTGSSIASSDSYSSVLEMLFRASSADSGSIRLYEDTDNGTNYVAIAASAAIGSNFTLRLPDNAGSDGQVLKTDGSGNLSWIAQTSGFSGFTISDGSNTSSITDTNTITFTSGEGIDAVVTQDGDALTISGEAASTTNAGISSYTSDFYFIDTWQVGIVTATTSVKGIASFNSTDFAVSAGGEVTVQAERIQDIAGAMVTGNTETLITVTYQDGDGTIDFVVDNDLANYSNTNSAFITAASSNTLTNKTFDANGTGNSISNLEVADFAASAITDSTDTIATNDSDSQVPTSAAVIDYVGAQIGAIDLTVSTAAGTNGSGTGSVSTSQTLTFNGTANEIDVTVSGQSVTYGLPNDVTIGGQLTVNGDLRVVGTAVTFETETVKVEDRLIELGLVSGAEPTSTTTWDTGVAFNYFQTSAKKSGVIWLNNQFMAMLSELSDGGGTDNDSPQITATAYAPVAAGGLYIGGIASGNEVINSSQEAVNLVFDGGTY
jgi:hypothetical protein